MKRREFIALLGGAAVVWPLAAHAQQGATPLLGFLHTGSSANFTHLVRSLHQGLGEAGYVEGQNLAVVCRWAEGDYGRLPTLAADLVRRHPDAIFAGGEARATLALKAATSTIPIVFVTGADPVTTGMVTSLNQPGGNVTGISLLSTTLNPKNLELLHELIPTATVIAVLLNRNSASADPALSSLLEAGHSLGLRIMVVSCSSAQELDAAFSAIAQLQAGALLVRDDPVFTGERAKLTTLAARHAIPTMYFLREFVTAGGLMSYGTSLADVYRQAGVYLGRILKGEKPADLPVQQPTKFELVINLKTAKALGINVPQSLLATADEVIE